LPDTAEGVSKVKEAIIYVIKVITMKITVYLCRCELSFLPAAF
jgi:hypothetical protein